MSVAIAMSDPIVELGRSARRAGRRHAAVVRRPDVAPRTARATLRAGSQAVISRTLVAVLAVCALVAALGAGSTAGARSATCACEVAQRLAGVETRSQADGQGARSQLADELRDAQAQDQRCSRRGLPNRSRSRRRWRRSIATSRRRATRSRSPRSSRCCWSRASSCSSPATCRRRSPRCSSPTPSCSGSTGRNSCRCGGRSRATSIGCKAVPFVDVTGLRSSSTRRWRRADACRSRWTSACRRRPRPRRRAAGRRSGLAALRCATLWDDAAHLVRIESSDRPAAPLLPPPQQYFLRENLRLRLLRRAHRAAESRRRELSAPTSRPPTRWLKQYFDTRTKSVQSVQATLKQLAATPTTGAMPDLTAASKRCGCCALAQERGAGRAAARLAGAR